MNNTAILFDIDNTLTLPRLPISNEMVQILKRLRIPFHVAAGSHMELLEEQFFTPLYNLGYRGEFDAFLSNGAIHYFCKYSSEININVVSKFNIRDYLGEKDYIQIIKFLQKLIKSPEFQLPSDIKVLGDQIAFRDSMINLCPIGRNKNNPEIYYNNRKEFVKFDNKYSYRFRLKKLIEKELFYYIKKRNLRITLGGETSFDIGILDQDKTIAVKTLLNKGVTRLIFFGDALFEGGNDAPIQAFVDNWHFKVKCPLETVEVSSWKDTIDNLYAMNLITKSELE